MNDKPIQQLLAFDFGTQKIGVAVGQTLTQSCTPLPEIKANDGQPNWDLVQSLINEWQPDALVVGVPRQMDGAEFELTARAKKFGRRLAGRFGLPCFGVDERLSSFEARELSAQQQGKGLVDSLAASLILQTWLRDSWPQLKSNPNQDRLA